MIFLLAPVQFSSIHHFIWFLLLSGFHSIAKGALKSFWAPFDKRPGSLWIFHSPAPNTLQMLIMKIRFWIEFISFKGASGWHFLFQYWTRGLSCLYNLNNMLWAFFNRPIYIILHTVQILKLSPIAYLYMYVVQAISYQLLLNECLQLFYLILKQEITCMKGSQNICFLIFYILSGTINQSIIWVASSSFMESSTYSPPDPHFQPFPFFLRTQPHFSESSEARGFWGKSILIPGWQKLAAFRRGQIGPKIFAFFTTYTSSLRVIANLQI